MEYIYHCKKTGLDYVLNSGSGTTLATPQDEYAWRRGAREYMDNYHASYTKDGLVKGKTVVAWTSESAWKDAVDSACGEAVTRFHAGDVPGTREPADPGMARVRAAAKSSGVDLTKIDPEKLVAWLQKQAASGRAA